MSGFEQHQRSAVDRGRRAEEKARWVASLEAPKIGLVLTSRMPPALTTPAWSRAETGVGTDRVAGSQL